MTYNAEGRIHEILDTQSKGNNFLTRDLILEIPGDYPQYVTFQFTGSYTQQPDMFSIGDDVTIVFSLTGREWNGRYFTNLKAQGMWSNVKKTEPQKVEAPSPYHDANDLPF